MLVWSLIHCDKYARIFEYIHYNFPHMCTQWARGVDPTHNHSLSRHIFATPFTRLLSIRATNDFLKFMRLVSSNTFTWSPNWKCIILHLKTQLHLLHWHWPVATHLLCQWVVTGDWFYWWTSRWCQSLPLSPYTRSEQTLPWLEQWKCRSQPPWIGSRTCSNPELSQCPPQTPQGLTWSSLAQ